MQKPFDIADLEQRLKAQGLPAVEGLAEIAAHQVFGWLKDSLSVEAQSNPLFLIGAPVLNSLEPLVMSEIKKIAPPADTSAAVPPAAGS